MTDVPSATAARHWQRFRIEAKTVADLMAFHARHKLLLMAHSTEAYRTLGPLVGSATTQDFDRTLDSYETTFLAAMAQPATRGRHVNVLQHIAGYFKRTLDSPARQDLATAIEDYQHGRVPLTVPLSRLADHARRHDVRYLLDQSYLDHPDDSV